VLGTNGALRIGLDSAIFWADSEPLDMRIFCGFGLVGTLACGSPAFVIAALVAAIPIQSATHRHLNRDARDKRGHDRSLKGPKIAEAID
jgi:hypothetical protein